VFADIEKFACGMSRSRGVAVSLSAPNSRVDRSARPSVDVNLECYMRARSPERYAPLTAPIA
jgi:hypothetical protein